MSLRQKIAKELIESGYPLEFYCKAQVMRIMSSSPSIWILSAPHHFLSTENKYREIDLEANVQSHRLSKGKDTGLISVLTVECKKNHSKPWVFFKDIFPPHLNILDASNKVSNGLSIDIFKRIKKHHYTKLSNKATANNYTVAFAQNNENIAQQIYKSILKLIEYFNYRKKRSNQLKRKDKTIVIYYLTIVFDGKMFLADFWRDAIKLREINHVVVTLTHTDPRQLKSQHYSIDIVRKDYFQNYLQLIESDHKHIFKYLNETYWS